MMYYMLLYHVYVLLFIFEGLKVYFDIYAYILMKIFMIMMHI